MTGSSMPSSRPRSLVAAAAGLLLAFASAAHGQPSPPASPANVARGAVAAATPQDTRSSGRPTGAGGAPWHRLVLVGDSIVANVPSGSWDSGLPARLQSALPRWVVWPY
ncbi:MAG: hypothetical protein ACKOCT_12075, partial [Alphaproteobacteria bacterium]